MICERMPSVMKLRAVLVLGLASASALAGCEVPVGTTAMAHESAPPPDGPPVASRYFSSYLGGGGADEITAIAASGGQSARVVVAGGTSSTNFPTTDGSTVDATTDAGCSGCPFDAFVTRLESPGVVVWSTVIGGPGYERATAVAIGGDLDVFVGGSAGSLTATTGAADPTFAGGSTAARGGEDGFVCRLDGATGATEWCTFIGGTGPGGVLGLHADWAGDDVVVVFNTAAGEDLHLESPYAAAFAGRHRALASGADTVVLRLDGTGQSLQWATYVGGSGDERGVPSVDVDGGAVHVLTTTASSDAPTPNGRITIAPPNLNGYLAVFSDDATTLRYGTYLGGGQNDLAAPHGLVVDGRAFVAINTHSVDMPTLQPSQSMLAGAGVVGCGANDPDGWGDGWLGVISTSAVGNASLTAATYLGGSQADTISGVGKTLSGDLVVSGRTYSSDFPTTAVLLPYQASLAGSPCGATPGSADGFVARFGVNGFAELERRQLSTYLGGSGVDGLTGVATGEGDFYIVAGASTSTDFPRVGGMAPAGGASDGVIATPAFWPPPLTAGDAGPDAPGADTDARADAGFGIDEGGGGCCGAGSGASSAPLALVVFASLWARRRRRA